MGATWTQGSAPYFAARAESGAVRVDGRSRISLGHKVDVGSGRAPGGSWVEWDWDGDSLTARNDRLRGYPLYYAASEDAVAISPSIETLLGLGVDRTLDLDAVAAFLTVGFYPGEDTAFKAIRALPGAADLTWRPGNLAIASSPPLRLLTSGTRADAVVRAAELMRIAVQRCIVDSDAYMMPISGGRDSRHILLELLHAGHRPVSCVTAHHHPHVWGGDVPYAARLCAEMGLEHQVVSPGPLINDEWRKNRITGYCADEHAWYLSVADALNGKTSHTYDGVNGSTLFARDYYSPRMRKLNDSGRLTELASDMGRKQGGRPRYLPLLAPSVRSELGAEAAGGRITRELERHADGPEPYLAFRFWGRTVGELNLTGTLMLHGVPVTYAPYLDPDVTEYMWSVPGEFIDDAFHDDVIVVNFPESNAIPYRPRTRPEPSPAFRREVNRGILHILRRHSDGSLVDRGVLMRRAALGTVTADPWFVEMRRAALTTYLVQLEMIRSGRGPIALD